MPKIPGVESFRGVQPITSTVIPMNLGRESAARAQAAQVEGQAGQAVVSLGQQAFQIGQQIQEREDRLAVVKQKSDFTQKMIAFESGLDGDTDYKTYGKRFNDEMEKARQEALGGVKNDFMRKTLDADLGLDISQGLSRMGKRAWQAEKENGLAQMNDILTNNRELALTTKDPNLRESLLNDMKRSIDIAVDNGYIAKDDGGKLHKAVAIDAAEAIVESYDADERKKILEAGEGIVKIIPSDRRKALIEKAEADSIAEMKKKDWFEQQAKEKLFNSASLSVEQNGSLEGIKTSDWVKLDQNQRNALKAQAKANAEGQDIPTDFETYYKLKLMASGSGKGDFAKTDLTQYRDKLGNTEYKELIGYQTAIREGKKTNNLDDFRTPAQMISKALLDAGIDPSPKEGTGSAKKVYAFYNAVGQEQESLQNRLGRKATNSELQQIIDSLILSGEVAGTGWFGTNVGGEKKGVYQLGPDEKYDIPDQDRSEIEAALTRAGRPITEGEVLRLYKAANE